MSKEVLVVTGAGGIGQAIARRQGPGKSVLLADFNEQTLQSAATALQGAGLDVATQVVDVSSRDSVSALARAATDLGSVTQVAHTAGQSPTMASPEAILTVDLLSEIAARKDVTPAQVALAWLLAQKPWIVPIPGTTKPGRLTENLGATAVELTADDLSEIERAAAQITVQGARYPQELEALVGR